MLVLLLYLFVVIKLPCFVHVCVRMLVQLHAKPPITIRSAAKTVSGSGSLELLKPYFFLFVLRCPCILASLPSDDVTMAVAVRASMQECRRGHWGLRACYDYFTVANQRAP